jgi:hypothetical protein
MAVLYTGMASGIMYGTGTTGNTPLVIFQNSLGSKVLMTIKRANLFHDAGNITSTIVKPIFRGYRVSNFNHDNGGGDLLAKGPFNTTQTSDPNVNIWTGNSTSLGAPSRFTATTGHQLWNILSDRLSSVAEQYVGGPASLLPQLVASASPAKLFKLYPGESYVVYDDARTANQDLTNHMYMVNVVWTEETLSTYTISGTVTLSGTGVDGAKVVIVAADDASLTNSYICGVQTTASGGLWSCDIPTGKIAYAYAQNATGGPTYYTAPGAPYLS